MLQTQNHNDHDDDFCGLEGNAEEPVKKREFNRWLAMALRYHVRPTKELLQENHTLITKHINEYRLTQDRILFGITILKWMVPVLVIVIPAVMGLMIYFMHKAGVL